MMTTKQRLGDIVKLSSGGTPSKKNADYWDGDIPWISAKNMKDEFLSESSLYITREGLNHGSKIAPKGSLLLLVRGSGLFNDVPICYVERDLAFNQDVKCIESIDPEKVPNKYIFYWLKSKKYALSQSVGVTTIGAGKFDTDFILNMEIPIPSREVMEKQISFFDAITKKIRYNTKINENLAEQMESLYKAWFKDYVPFGGQCPSDWKVSNIYSIADIIYGAPFSSKRFNTNGDGLPIIRIRDLKEQAFTTYTTEQHPKGHLIKPGDIVVGMDGEFRPYLWGNTEAWLNQRVCIFNNKRPEGKAFVFYTIKPLLYQIEQTQVATTVIHIGKKDYDAFEFLLPDADTLDHFDSLTKPMIDQIVNNCLENKRLAEMRDVLLPRLMSGELDVSGLDL